MRMRELSVRFCAALALQSVSVDAPRAVILMVVEKKDALPVSAVAVLNFGSPSQSAV